MSKIEVYVPFDGKRDVLVAYFENQGVIWLGGLPVTDLTLPADASEEQVRDIAVDFTYAKYIDKSDYIIGETDFFRCVWSWRWTCRMEYRPQRMGETSLGSILNQSHHPHHTPMT